MKRKNKIVPFWHPALHKRAREVEPSEKVDDLIKDMIEVVKEEKGVGLAAPQIGKRKRVIVIDNGNEKFKALLNPKIIEKSPEKIIVKEGCLSVSGVWCDIERAKRVKVEAENDSREKIVIEAEDIMAVILQHEIDHLEGRLFIDNFKFTTKLKLIITHVFNKQQQP